MKLDNRWVQEDCISRLQVSLVNLVSNGTIETKLAKLAYMCCGVFVKSPIGEEIGFCFAKYWICHDRLTCITFDMEFVLTAV